MVKLFRVVCKTPRKRGERAGWVRQYIVMAKDTTEALRIAQQHQQPVVGDVWTASDFKGPIVNYATYRE